MAVMPGRVERYTDEVGLPPLDEIGEELAVGVSYPSEEFWFSLGEVTSPEEANARLVQELAARPAIDLALPARSHTTSICGRPARGSAARSAHRGGLHRACRPR